MVRETQIRLHIPAEKVKAYKVSEKTTGIALDKLGFAANRRAVTELGKIYNDLGLSRLNGTMDIAPPLQTTPYLGTPVQFLQTWFPELIAYLTQARTIDELLGRTIAGRWEDEEVVQVISEHTGQARVYFDKTTTPLASYNLEYERSTIVRFEEGVEVGVLEEARAERFNINSLEHKRQAAANSLAISLNYIGFFGYNNGTNRTYGLLNNPNLPDYITASTGASGDTTWNTKTYAETTNDIRLIASELRVQSGGNIRPERDAWVLAVPLNKTEYLNIENDFGKSVYTWIQENYPNVRIVSIPEFDGANGGEDVLYAFAETINGQPVMRQIVPEVFRLIGSERWAKNFREVYSNASAGVMVLQPLGVIRMTGI